MTAEGLRVMIDALRQILSRDRWNRRRRNASGSNQVKAVIRLSSLTNRPPESLGPGSKERKSVLLNLATDLGLEVDSSRWKQRPASRSRACWAPPGTTGVGPPAARSRWTG